MTLGFATGAALNRFEETTMKDADTLVIPSGSAGCLFRVRGENADA